MNTFRCIECGCPGVDHDTKAPAFRYWFRPWFKHHLKEILVRTRL